MEQNTAIIFSALTVVGFGLLVLVSVGIVYLTLVDWRDRRRQSNDQRER